MDDANKLGFNPAPEFQEDARAPLIEPTIRDATELWLIQWPKDQVPDFDGQQLSLDIHRGDGQLGTLESASGKSYDVVGLAAQEPKATVFLSTAANSKIVGKITRRVSFVHYLEASEVPKDDTKKLKQLYERSLTNSGHHFMTPTTTKSIRSRQLVSASGGRASTHSSGHKSSLSEEKNSMRKHVIEVNMSSQDSGLIIPNFDVINHNHESRLVLSVPKKHYKTLLICDEQEIGEFDLVLLSIV